MTRQQKTEEGPSQTKINNKTDTEGYKLYTIRVVTLEDS